MEGLTDRQAADAVRTRIDWKYLLCLELTDPGFDHKVLSEFRTRLLVHEAKRRLFDTNLAHATERNWVKTGGRQRSDSTHVLGAMHVALTASTSTICCRCGSRKGLTTPPNSVRLLCALLTPCTTTTVPVKPPSQVRSHCERPLCSLTARSVPGRYAPAQYSRRFLRARCFRT